VQRLRAGGGPLSLVCSWRVAHTPRTDSEGLQTTDGWLAGNGGEQASKRASKQPMRNPPPGWVGAKRATAAADGYLYDICGLHTSRANNG